jgi:hypothetical protein
VQLAPAAPSAQPELDYLNRHADGSAYLSSTPARVGGGGLFGQSSDTLFITATMVLGRTCIRRFLLCVISAWEYDKLHEHLSGPSEPDRA